MQFFYFWSKINDFTFDDKREEITHQIDSRVIQSLSSLRSLGDLHAKLFHFRITNFR